MTRIKICGLCRAGDAAQAAAAGADYLGFVFASSPRRAPATLAAELRAALPATAPPRVGVFGAGATPADIAATARAFGLDYLQLHGRRSPAELAAIRAAAGLELILALAAGEDDPDTARASAPFALLLDTPRPAGEAHRRPFDWRLAVPAARAGRLFLAGGLRPENVGEAIHLVAPFAVDVASGVELSPGVKSEPLLHAFIAAVRAADRARAPGTAEDSLRGAAES